MEGEREVEEVIKQDELFFKNEEIFFQKKKSARRKAGKLFQDMIWSFLSNRIVTTLACKSINSFFTSFLFFFFPSPQTQKVFSFNVKKNPGKT